jgi:hypothetical protein
MRNVYSLSTLLQYGPSTSKCQSTSEHHSFFLVRLTVMLRPFFMKVIAVLYWCQDTMRLYQDTLFLVRKLLPEFFKFLFSWKKFLIAMKVTTSSGICWILVRPVLEFSEFLSCFFLVFLTENRDVHYICLIPSCPLHCQDSAETVSWQCQHSVKTSRQHHFSVKTKFSKQNISFKWKSHFFSVTEVTTSTVTVSGSFICQIGSTGKTIEIIVELVSLPTTLHHDYSHRRSRCP